MKPSLLLTCEHATNYIPKAYTGLFAGRKGRTLLKTHRGYDLGAIEVAKFLAQSLYVRLFAFPVSRLLIEGNRYRFSSLFSPLTKSLSRSEKEKIVKAFWLPHVNALTAEIKKRNTAGAHVLHIGQHSFEPVLHGVVRKTDIGILFDPRRPQEKKYAHALQQALHSVLSPHIRVRRNYPYTGVSEGLSTYLRGQFSDRTFSSIEIEVNNKHIRNKTKTGEEIQKALLSAIRSVLKV